MQQPGAIWIDVQRGPDGLYWARFAAAVLLRQFEERNKFRLGWNAGSLIEEGMDRQLQFLEAQYVQEWYPGLVQDGDARRLAIRFINTPSQPRLSVFLVAILSAKTKEAALKAAQEYWEEISAIFPYDYMLRPALTPGDFRSACCPELTEEIREPDDAVEIRRYANDLRGKSRGLIFLGQWRQTSVASEQIWRALRGCSRPLMMQVTLQPVALREEERVWMLAQEQAANQLARDENEPPLTRKYAEFAAQVYKEQAQSYRNLFLEHVLLASPSGVPGYICRAIGASFTHGEDRPSPLPGYLAIKLGPPAREWLEGQTLPWEDEAGCNLHNRFVYLMNARQAHVAFRFPLPSGAGIPGVEFETA